MKLSPNLMAVLSVLVLIEQAIGGGTVLLTNAIPEAWIPVVKSWCLILAFVGTAVLGAGHFFAGPGIGPLASPPTVREAQTVMDEARKAAVLLMACLVGLALLGLGNASAQDRTPRPRPPEAEPRESAAGLTPLICDPLNLLPGCKSPVTGQTVTSDASKAITQVFTSLATFVDQGVTEAEQLAMAIPDLPDGVGQQCWMQMRKTSAVFKAHPVPVTLQLPLDLQAIRLLVMSANDLCASSACTQLFSDAANLATAAAGAGGFSIPIPSLASVCSKIPVIRSTPTVADPTLPPVGPVAPLPP